MMSPDEIIEVVQAYKDGKQIQYRTHNTKDWTDLENPSWECGTFQYRIKPEQKIEYHIVKEYDSKVKETVIFDETDFDLAWTEFSDTVHCISKNVVKTLKGISFKVVDVD